VLVAQRLHHSFPFLWAEVGLKALRNLATNLLHDLHVWALRYLSGDLNLVSMRWHLFDLVLSNLLVEHLVVELLGRAINKPVVKFSTVWLHQVHLARGGAVGQLIGATLGVSVNALLVHHLLMRKGRVLHRDQTLRWRSVLPHMVPKESRLTCVLSDVVIHYTVETFIFPA